MLRERGQKRVPLPPARMSAYELFCMAGCRGLSFAEAAVAGGIVPQGCFEVFAVEVRPEPVGDVEFGVADLPEEEVGDAHFARGADEEVRVGDAGGVEVIGDGLFGDVLWGECTGGDFSAMPRMAWVISCREP